MRGVIPANGFILKPVEGDPDKTSMTRITAVCEVGRGERGEGRGEGREGREGTTRE